jgi:hypothetical protein
LIPGREDILARLFSRQFGQPIVRNDLRGELVEEIVGAALEPDWRLCGGDWAAYDVEHVVSGLKIQVKQSAAKQSWHALGLKISSPRFSIATKTGRYEGANWKAEESRNADIFVFAWHPITDETCDHADPEQWQFYVVSETQLPVQKSVGIKQITKLSKQLCYNELSAALATLINFLRPTK